MAERPPRLGDKERAFLKLALFVLLVGIGYLLVRYTGVGAYFTRSYLQEALGRFDGWVAALAFVATFTVGVMMAAPATLFFILGGVLFGPALGTALVILGATCGASGAFLIARFLAREFVEKIISGRPWFERIDRGVRRDGVYFVLFLRLVPFFPFNGLNFAIGLTHIRFRDYFVGTLVGIAPVSYVFVNAAAKAAEAAEKGVSREFYFSLALLGCLALTPVAYNKYKRWLDAGSENEEDGQQK